MRTNRADPSVTAQLELVLAELAGLRREVWKLRRELYRDKEKIMSALDDLKQTMSDLVNEATTDVETVIEKIGSTPPDDTAALQALTQQGKDAIAKLKADMAAITTPTPAPSTGTDSPPST